VRRDGSEDGWVDDPGAGPGEGNPTAGREAVVRLVRFAGGYWRSDQSRAAWFWTLAVVAMVVATITVNVGLNRWNGEFYNALERRDAGALAHAVLLLPALMLGVAAVGVGMVLCRETLQVRWRAWLVGSLLRRWMGPARGRVDEASHPEHRIADDSRMLVEPTVDLFIGLLNAILTATAFIGILYAVGGTLDATVAGQRIVLPGYMVMVALLYGALVSCGMIWVGRPLIARLGLRSEAEAQFRSAVRDRATAGYRDPAGLEPLQRRYGHVVRRSLDVVTKNCHIAWISNTNGVFVSILPVVVCMPKYLAGEYSLGDVMRIAPAFVQVQIAISWLVDNFRALAQAYASAERIGAMIDAGALPAPAASAAPAVHPAPVIPQS
jgi:putative ATP-binding cassette transporter